MTATKIAVYLNIFNKTGKKLRFIFHKKPFYHQLQTFFLKLKMFESNHQKVQYFSILQKQKNAQQLLYSTMINRSKKLTLNAPYSKISKALWESKKINSEKQKENLQLYTKVQHLQNSKSIKEPQGGQFRKLEEKYEKLSNKFKEQTKWIKQTSEMIEERKFEQLNYEVKKLQNKLDKQTQKAINSEKKLQKYIAKMKKYELINQQDEREQSQTDIKSPFDELEAEKSQLLELLKSRQEYVQDIDKTNRRLNKQIIQLLAIKSKLRNQVKQRRQNQSNCQKISFSKPIVEQVNKRKEDA